MQNRNVRNITLYWSHANDRESKKMQNVDLKQNKFVF